MVVNPAIFKLTTKTNWDSKFFETKSNELKFFSINQIEINKVLNLFLSKYGLKLMQLKLYNKENSIFFFIIFDSLPFKSKKPNFIQNKITNELLLFNKIFKKKKIILNLIKLTTFYKLKFKTLIYYKNYFKFLHFISQKFKKYNYLFRNYIKFIRYLNKLNYNKLFKLINSKLASFFIQKFHILKLKNLILNDKVNKKFILNFIFKKIKNILSSFLKSDFNLLLLIKQLNKNNFNNLTVKNKNKLALKLLNLKKFEKNNFFKTGTNLLFNATKNNIVFFISNFIKTELSILKDARLLNLFFRFLVNNVKYFLLFSNKIQGIEIKIKGNLTKKQRAVTKNIILGKKLPKTTINSELKFGQSIAYTKKGTFGINIWAF